MNEQIRISESKWNIICRKARVWEGRPQLGGIRSFVSRGGSDTGLIEYNGSILRFTGKKLQIEVSAIKSISLVKPNLRTIYFLVYFAILSLVLWLLGSASLRQSARGILSAVILAALAAIISWWYLREYGGWVWLTYTGPDGQLKDIGFWGAPASGGSQRLYNDLVRLINILDRKKK